ncbi:MULTISPECIES: SRPBCC domain-containing protein [Acidobacteriaceae]|uniref:SRPBCC domain-containing protein n=1 Tax=Acidobacteriaceae TaxID=204434 RepID=UPI0020B10C54|nr:MULTISPECIES: SRPBCC domain-containing protein [Acidobacteriaceae]MDW5266015.1 SRPBCC domain-containing protein [Edaphobacter sp.]
MLELLEAMPELQEDERTIVSTRVFNAPRKMVYEAFADPTQVVEWWGPHGFSTTVLEMDLRPGGKWRIVMHSPDGTNYPNEMTFTAVVPEERIELDLVGGKEGAALVSMHKTITWQEEDGGTRLTLSNQFDSRELRDENVRTYGSVQGARELFERLNKVLAAKGATA